MAGAVELSNSVGISIASITVRGKTPDTIIEMENCLDVVIGNITGNLKNSNEANRYYDGIKLARNSSCPCGSGAKFKRCHGEFKMSTGIKATNNSKFTAGTANIVADIGVDLDNSVGHIEIFNFLPSEGSSLEQLFENFSVKPSRQLVEEAASEVAATRDANVLQKSKLKTWFDDQGLTASLWVNVAATIAAAVLSK